MEQTNAAPLGLRLELSYGKMFVDAGQVSGDSISIASQLASRAASGQMFAAESMINALGDSVRNKLRSLGTIPLEAIQGETEIFEIQWQAGDAQGTTRQSPTPAKSSQNVPSQTGPSLRVQNRGKEIVLTAKHPSVTLRSGKEREVHAKIELRENDFYLLNLKTNGTRVRMGEEETLCLDELLLEGQGAISLGLDFREGSPEVLHFTKNP